MYRNPAWMYCVPVLIWLYKFLLCFPINVSASYYKVDCTSFMGNSRGGLNSSSYYENKVCNNRRKINCVDADEPCIPWAWDSNMKQCWGPGCNITKHDSLEERTSSAFILVFPPFFLVIHTSSQTTQEVCTNLRGESGMGKQNEICSKGLCMFYFSSSWKLSVALWNKISFAGRKLYNQDRKSVV